MWEIVFTESSTEYFPSQIITQNWSRKYGSFTLFKLNKKKLCSLQLCFVRFLMFMNVCLCWCVCLRLVHVLPKDYSLPLSNSKNFWKEVLFIWKVLKISLMFQFLRIKCELKMMKLLLLRNIQSTEGVRGKNTQKHK